MCPAYNAWPRKCYLINCPNVHLTNRELDVYLHYYDNEKHENKLKLDEKIDNKEEHQLPKFIINER